MPSTMKNRKLAIIFGLIFSSQLPAHADQQQGFHWEIDLGVAMSYSQVLIDSLQEHDNNLSLTPLAAGGIYYDRLFIESTPLTSRPVTFGYSLLKQEDQQLNLIVESLFIEISEQKQERGHKLDGLDKRRASLEVGIEYYRAYDDVDLRLSYLQDGLDNHNGSYASIGVAFPRFTSQLFLLPSLTLEYLDSDIIDYYLGVDSHEATSKRETYHPGAAWRAQARLYLEHPLNESWSLLGALRYSLFSDEISDSPLVAPLNETYGIHLGVLWSF